jgi:hypothetical protein
MCIDTSPFPFVPLLSRASSPLVGGACRRVFWFLCGTLLIIWNINVLLVFVLWVVCCGRGIYWCPLHYIDVWVCVSAYWYTCMLPCLRVSFLPCGLSWNIIFLSMGCTVCCIWNFGHLLYSKSVWPCVGGVLPARVAVWNWCYCRFACHVFFVWWCV